MRRTASAVALAAVLLAGCSAEPAPGPADPGPAAPAGTADDTRPPLVFNSGSSASVEAECEDRDPVFFEVALPMVVRREVVLGEVTVDGDARLVGPVLLGPRVGRGDSGVVSAGPRPGFDTARREPGWRQRQRLAGSRVDPGTWTVFLQVRIAPGDSLAGFDVAWDDGDSRGTEQLGHGLGVTRDCG